CHLDTDSQPWRIEECGESRAARRHDLPEFRAEGQALAHVDQMRMQSDRELMDEGPAIGASNVHRPDRAMGEGRDRLVETKRYAEAAGKEIHRAGRQNGERLVGVHETP